MFEFENKMKEEIYTQVKLRHKNITQTCWLDLPKSIKPGNCVKLKGGGVWWAIEDIYGTSEKCELNKKWKVGGL